MAMNKAILRWWLIGYATGDSTVQVWGLRTSTANPLIAKRLEKILGRPWRRKAFNDGHHRKPLYLFKISDPQIIRIIEEIRREYRFPRASKAEIKAWLAGYLDADGCLRPTKSWMGGHLFTIDWMLARLIIKLCVRVGLKTTVQVSAFRGKQLRKNPIFKIYARPLDDLPSVKIQSFYNGRR